MLNHCIILHWLYGRDTRGVQLFSVLTTIMWILIGVSNTFDATEIALPSNVVNELPAIMAFAFASLVFSLVGFVTTKRMHQTTKGFGLLLSALTHAVIANGYVTAYPPLDMMLVVSTAISLWFFCAVFYISKCEGFDGNTKRAP